MKKLYVITGQTATGKTAHALDLAFRLKGAIINFDSRQIYKYLDIVTGKDITQKNFSIVEKTAYGDIGYYTIFYNKYPVQVWLYDIVEPNILFSSFDYQSVCIPLLKKLLDTNTPPILVGGSYLYLYFLLYGKQHLQQANWDVRKKLNEKTVEQLQDLARTKNRDQFNLLNNSDKHNPHRLIRFLEKDEIDSILKFEYTVQKKLGYDHTDLAIQMKGFRHKEKNSLRSVIKKRVLKRLEEGALSEIQHIHDRGFSLQDPGLQSIGCKQILQFLDQSLTYDGMVEEWTLKEYKYAKRQSLFMNRDPHIIWTEI